MANAKNVGDKFEITSSNGVFKEGETLTLIRLESDGVHRYRNEEGVEGYAANSRLTEFNQPVKGDKFVITGNGSPTHYYNKGEIVTYKGSTSASGSMFVINDDPDSGGQYINPKHLAPHNEKSKYNVGDIVLIKSYSASPYLFTNPRQTGVIEHLNASSKGHRGDVMVRIKSEAPRGGTYAIGFKLSEIEPFELVEGDYIVIDLEATKRAPHGTTRDLTEGKSYKVESTGGELFFSDDVGDTRTTHIQQGLYTVVGAPLEKAPSTPKLAIGDFVTIDIKAADEDGYYVGDITKGKAYEIVEDDDGDLVFVDDDGDEQYGIIDDGFYTIVAAPLVVGDYVVATGPTPYSITNEDMLLGKVVKVVDSGYMRVEVIAAKSGTNAHKYIGENYGVTTSCFRKATYAEITKHLPKPKVELSGEPGRGVKIGDKIRIIGNGFMNGGQFGPHFGNVGDIVKVTTVLSDRVLTDGIGAVHNDFFEVVYEEAAATPELKVGDLAEVVADGFSDTYNSHDIEIGTIVKLKQVGRIGKQKYEAIPVGSEDTWAEARYFVEGDLRKVGGTPTPIAEEPKFEVGDIVRITENTSSRNKEGDIGEVVRNDHGTIKVFVNARGENCNYHVEDSLELIAKARK